VILNGPDETAELGARVARALRPHEAVLLFGELGAGKSTLARGLIRALCGQEEEVPSPTFTLVQHYASPGLILAHFDLYRLARGDEVAELGLDEALDEGAAVIEWPERLAPPLPPDRLDIVLTFEGEARRARLTAHGAWQGREL
jgi:tRNA threonylcarbamoyladenosine biosynthesis protein TsaE